ncbi:hypothetical protein C825_003944 [Parabacteroides sp. ASF519]|uniref:hypothetical protein n=1 Tax=Parabacteroides sp. ASF519 TaxID=1235803 RepID=UPI00202CC0ED|nr:hypothetical protein [Parabacteroides sp. ASF519]KAI4361870.1 hypothetical protein C825_003944 [Parabacteroides sp. ASF519]
MNKRLLACFLLTVLYCSCTQNEVVTGMGKGKEVSTCFHLNVLASTIAQTRSMVITTEGTTEVDSIPVPVGGQRPGRQLIRVNRQIELFRTYGPDSIMKKVNWWQMNIFHLWLHRKV